MTRTVLAVLLSLTLVDARSQPTTLTLTFSDELPSRGTVRGTCFLDKNSDAKRDAGEVAVAGVAISDGVEVVLTNSEGAYELPVTEGAVSIFMTTPAGYRPANNFYHQLRQDTAVYDFPLVRNSESDRSFSFAHISDVQVSGEADLQRLSFALGEIQAMRPVPRFIVATGDHVDSATRTELFDGVVAQYRRNGVPVYSVPGTYDLLPGNSDPLAAYRATFGPPYYSVSYPGWHLLFLNSTGTSPYQSRWIEEDLKAAGRDNRIMVFQYHVPRPEQIEQMQLHGVRAIFTGQWHGTRMELDRRGVAVITQPPLLMGSLDGSPASFRLVRVGGDQLNTEQRAVGSGVSAQIVAPDAFMNAGTRLMVNLLNSSGGGVKEARFRLQVPGSPPFAEGGLVQISPTTWMAPLDARTNVPENLPPSFDIRVRATGYNQEQWETSRTVQQGPSALPVKPGENWPQFMGTAQRTGRAASALAPPLRLAWASPTHGAVAVSSPVLYKGKVAIGVRDTENLINNGVAVFDAITGKRDHFVKSDTMLNHSPVFAEDKEDGPGTLWATTAGGEILQIHPLTGKMQSSGELGPTEWLYSSPAVQGRLTVFGNSAFLQGFDSHTGEHRWTSPGGSDWPPSFGSPSLAGPVVLMTGNWIQREQKPASVYALDAANGRLQWSIESSGASGSVAVGGGRGYFIDNQGALVCFEAETGKPLARVPLDKSWSISTPAVDPQIIVAPGGAGTVYGFETRSMKRLWKFESGQSRWTLSPYRKERKAVFSSPTISGDWVYIGCSDGKLYCINKWDGKPAWSYDFGVPTLATPCISGNTLVTAAMDGNLYAFTAARP